MIETLLYSLLSGILFCLLLFVLLHFGIKLISKKQSTGTSEEIAEIDKSIIEIDSAINSAVEQFETLSSLNQLDEIEKTKSELNDILKKVQSRLSQLDVALSSKQADVDKAEASHNDLKRSKEAAAILADELKQIKERLESEHKALEGELNQSLTQLELLSKELKLNPQAESGINKIHNALNNSKTQLKTLTQLYQQGSTRFVNLQTQYKDLEKEYTKLVEKELSG